MAHIFDRLRTTLLGTDPRQQLRASQSLLVLSVYLVFAFVQHVEVLLGMIDADASWPLTAWNLAGGFGFYLLIRSGLNLRLSKDRALQVPQSLWAMVGISWSYGITGPARGAVMLIMLVVLIFGMFSLSSSAARRMAALGFGMIGAVMVWKAWTDPLRYDPRVEAMHLIFAGIVMAAVSTLSIRIGRLRSRLEEQRGELTEALERIQALATRDELTGLLNRRAMLDRMRAELLIRQPTPRPTSLALVDLDHFKGINDVHGHATGDAVLREFGQRAQSCLRAGDVVARWGGEEFLLLLPATSAAQALLSVARLREGLRGGPSSGPLAELAVTFSAGVAECTDATDLEAAIERADRAMYRAKNAGRDRAFGPD